MALALSLPIMFWIHSVQRDEESLVIDCQQYCLEHLVNRLYEPEFAGEPRPGAGRELTPPGAIAGSLGERVAR